MAGIYNNPALLKLDGKVPFSSALVLVVQLLYSFQTDVENMKHVFSATCFIFNFLS
jgi:hypothetical protein